jgi:transposase
LTDYRVKASREEVARSLEGNWRADVLFELQQAVDSYHFAHRQMLECDEKLQLYLVSLPVRPRGDAPTPSKGAPDTPAKKRKKTRKPRGNEPQLDLQAERERVCGVDLTSIDGIRVMTAFTVISEVGTDMSRFQDEHHFTSWMGLAPSKDISGGKIIGGGKKKVKNRVAVVLRTAATTLLESDTHLGARYLAVLIYRLLTKGEAWVDRGRSNLSNGASNGNWRACRPKPRRKDSPWFPSQKPAESNRRRASPLKNAISADARSVSPLRS